MSFKHSSAQNNMAEAQNKQRLAYEKKKLKTQRCEVQCGTGGAPL